MPPYNRRKEDKVTMQTIISKVGAWMAIIGSLGGGFFWLGSTKFESKEMNSAQHEVLRCELQAQRENILVMKNDLQYIKQGIDEIKASR